MAKHDIKEWATALRIWSAPASAMPVIVFISYIYWRGAGTAGTGFDLYAGIAALFLMILLHAAGNTWSDCFDFRYRVDAEDTFGATSLTTGMFSMKEIMGVAMLLTAISVAGGVVMVVWKGWALLWIGIAGVVCMLLYPYLKYRAAGDIAILLTFGILPSFGINYVVSGSLSADILWAAVPVSLITVAILHAGNTRDTVTDRRAEIKTIPIAIGSKWTKILYYLELSLPFPCVAAAVAAGAFPVWSLIALFALIPAFRNMRTMQESGGDNRSLSTLDESTAKLQLVFSLLLAASFIIGGVLRAGV